MITAIANNELEISNLAYSSLAIAIENAGLDDIRVIADEFQDGVPGYFSQQYYVRKDSGITKVEDLKGKVVGTNGAGSAVDVAIRAMLRKHGLEANRDYTLLEGPLPAMPAMLLEKKADLIPAVLPFALNPKLREDGKILFEQKDALGVTQMIVLERRANRSSTRTAPPWSTSWRTCCASCTGTSTRKTTTTPPKSHPRSPRRRRSGSAGCSPRPTPIAIRIWCRTSTRSSETSTPRANWASSRSRSTSKNTPT